MFFQGYREYNIILETVANNSNEDLGPVHETYSKVYSKGYIISLLFEPLDYDVQVDNYLINKNTHDKSRISHYELSKEYYRKEYIYDSKGNISKIKFIVE